VGTKLKLAFQLNRHDTVGQDLVAMSVNDILVQGAEPLFFLDYFACGKLDVDTAATVIKGIAHGCELAGCALIGGETAEMPSMYPDGEYDLAGFAVGAVEEEDHRRQHDHPGRRGAGPGFVGRAFERLLAGAQDHRRGPPDLDADFHGQRLQDAIMAPTRIYVKPLLSLIETLPVKGMAHITGGGLTENVPRVLADNVTAVIQRDAWTLPPLFQWLQAKAAWPTPKCTACSTAVSAWS
jgi:phosphoribosylformylglycinamidine cyclo-ligase